MFKKLIGLALIAVFSLSLVACGGSDNAGEIKKADTQMPAAQNQMPGSQAPATNTQQPANPEAPPATDSAAPAADMKQ